MVNQKGASGALWDNTAAEKAARSPPKDTHINKNIQSANGQNNGSSRGAIERLQATNEKPNITKQALVKNSSFFTGTIRFPFGKLWEAKTSQNFLVYLFFGHF